MPATISSCLNSCGLCGRAYQEPGLSRAGHQEVAGALGRRAGQGRASRSRRSRGRRGSLRATRLTSLRSRRAAAWAGPAQVEVAVLQPGLLADGDPLVDLERQRGGGAEHLELGGDHLDGAGGQVGVRVALGPQRDLADDLDAVLVAEVVRAGGLQHLVPHHHLDDAGGVAQVEEGHPAVVAAAGDPAGQGDGGSSVLGPEGAGAVGADHRLLPSNRLAPWTAPDPTAAGRGARRVCGRRRGTPLAPVAPCGATMTA